MSRSAASWDCKKSVQHEEEIYVKKMKCLVCSLLCLVMALSVLVPVTAFADDEVTTESVVRTATKKVKYTLQDENGTFVSGGIATVENDATVVPETACNIPEGYHLVGEIKINGRFARGVVAKDATK